MNLPKGYTIRTVAVTRYDGKPTWNARVRRQGWRDGYWITVSSDYGPIAYASSEAAHDGATWWINKNEGRDV